MFCGGGTAGHVNPAIAVAETVMRNSGESKIAYIATLNGIENRLVDFKKYYVDVIGMKHGFSFFGNIFFAVKQLKAIEQCKEYIKEFRPDVIFGTGGYATYAAIVAGKKLGVKTVIHESNAIPGKAVLALQKKADAILVNFEESKEHFKCREKVIRTGNPLRIACESITKERAKRELNIRQKHVILCTGGSLGAERINNSAIELIDNFVKYRDDIFFVWSTGRGGYEYSVKALEERGLDRLENILVGDYFKEMPKLISASDIVISRAGAMTISELAYMKKASILVPSPNVANNHQFANAETLRKADAAIVITEDRLYTIIEAVRDLLTNFELRSRLSINIGKYAVNDANKKIFSILSDMAR